MLYMRKASIFACPFLPEASYGQAGDKDKITCTFRKRFLLPRSQQGLDTFKSCLVKHSLKLFPRKSCFGFFFDYRFSTNESIS